MNQFGEILFVGDTVLTILLKSCITNLDDCSSDLFIHFNIFYSLNRNICHVEGARRASLSKHWFACTRPIDRQV